MFASNAALLDRFHGALVGLAVGDALGTTLEFYPPGTFEPITDLVGGGPFRLKPGEWTDDTSMALCLAESLLERGDFDAVAQLRRYVRWWKDGHLSSTARCVDIGNTVRAALERFQATGAEFCGSTDPRHAGNGSLMRLAPVPLFYLRDPMQGIFLAGESSRTTHQARTAIDACRYYAALISGALVGVSKDTLLSQQFSPVPGCWKTQPLHPEVEEIATGAFRRREPPEIKGTGYVVRSMEAALWAFDRSSSFEEGCLMAVNLGDDADTTGAIFGQLAGAFYGESGIPTKWREKIAKAPLIKDFARRLHEFATRKASA